MTPAEFLFFRQLQDYLPEDVLVFSKVSLKDIFYVGKGVGKDYQKYQNKIAQKHVDFLICARNTMQPLYGVELDDKSHRQAKRRERDAFVDRVYETVGLKLIHVPVKREYPKEYLDQFFLSTPSENQEPILKPTEQAPVCPKCGATMVLRTAKRGDRAGTSFYGCPNYPKCREVMAIEDAEEAV